MKFDHDSWKSYFDKLGPKSHWHIGFRLCWKPCVRLRLGNPSKECYASVNISVFNTANKSQITQSRIYIYMYRTITTYKGLYLVDWSCISNCCSWDVTLCAAAARLLTEDSCDNNSAIGSIASRPLGESPVSDAPPDEKCMFDARRVRAPLTPRPGWGILRTWRIPVGSSWP